jgi:hypothetical protein
MQHVFYMLIVILVDVFISEGNVNVTCTTKNRNSTLTHHQQTTGSTSRMTCNGTNTVLNPGWYRILTYIGKM